MKRRTNRQRERGAALLEFSIVASALLLALFGIVEFGRLLWTHNALKDAARRGTRYAIVRKDDTAGQTAVKNMVVYGDPAPAAGAQPILPGLTTANVVLDYQNYNGVQLSSRATVSITNYKFQFAVPMIGGQLSMPAYRTSLPGESVGFIPCDIPSGTPSAPCNIVPN